MNEIIKDIQKDIKDIYLGIGKKVEINRIAGRSFEYWGNKYTQMGADNRALLVEVKEVNSGKMDTIVFFSGADYRNKDVLSVWLSGDYDASLSYLDEEGFLYREFDREKLISGDNMIEKSEGQLIELLDSLMGIETFQDAAECLSEDEYLRVDIQVKKEDVSEFHIEQLKEAIEKAEAFIKERGIKSEKA